MRIGMLVVFSILAAGIANCGATAEPVTLVVGHGDFAILFAQRDKEVDISELAGKQFFLQSETGAAGKGTLSGIGENPDMMCSNPVAMEGAPNNGYIGTDRPVRKLKVESFEHGEPQLVALIARELARLEARPASRIDRTWLIEDQRNKWVIVSAFSFSHETYITDIKGDFGGFFVFEMSDNGPRLIGSELAIVGQPFGSIINWQDDLISAFRDNGNSEINIVVQTDHEQGTAYTRFQLGTARLTKVDEAGCGG